MGCFRARAAVLPAEAASTEAFAPEVLLGGGGTVNPPTEMVLQVLTALLVVPLVLSASYQRGLGPVQVPAWILAGLVLLMPVAQLIPLPPSIWQALPGRAVELESLALIQADQSWMPLTLSPARTFASLLAMICALLLMLQVSRLSLRGRTWLCAIIVAVGLLSLVLGVLQLSHTGGITWSLYDEFSEGFLVGFQANRNAEADILMISMLAAGVLICTRASDDQPHMLSWVGFSIGILALFVGLFMTGSRMGISLFPITLIFLALMIWPVVRNRRPIALGAAGVAILSVVGSLLLLQLPSVKKVLVRFALTRETRWELWADTWYAIRQVWPFGSGIGTIVPMLEAAERLEVVDTTRPVRAHNDWLEWMLETGIPGMVVLGLIFLIVAFLIVRALIGAYRSDAPPARRAQVLFACGFLVIESLHAIVDYPLRSMSIAALAAVAMAFVLDPAAPQREKR